MQVGLLAVIRGDAPFAQSVMLGSILSDILFVCPRLPPRDLILTGVAGSRLLFHLRCVATTDPQSQPSRRRRPIFADDYHRRGAPPSDSFILYI